MARGREEAAWNHTAQLLAMLANVNRDPKRRSRPYAPADFHPYLEDATRASEAPIADVSMADLSGGQFAAGIDRRPLDPSWFAASKPPDGGEGR